MKMPRWIATLAIAAAAFALIAYTVVRPLRCNYVEGDVQRVTERIDRASAAQVTLAPYARRSIQRLMPCLGCENGVNRAMLLAINLRFVGRKEEAMELYRNAMRYDRRPELYLSLGETQLELGRNAEALQNLTIACRYNPDYLDEITTYHEELRRAVDSYYLELAAAAKKRGEM